MHLMLSLSEIFINSVLIRLQFSGLKGNNTLALNETDFKAIKNARPPHTRMGDVVTL